MPFGKSWQTPSIVFGVPKNKIFLWYIVFCGTVLNSYNPQNSVFKQSFFTTSSTFVISLWGSPRLLDETLKLHNQFPAILKDLLMDKNLVASLNLFLRCLNILEAIFRIPQDLVLDNVNWHSFRVSFFLMANLVHSFGRYSSVDLKKYMIWHNVGR